MDWLKEVLPFITAVVGLVAALVGRKVVHLHRIETADARSSSTTRKARQSSLPDQMLHVGFVCAVVGIAFGVLVLAETHNWSQDIKLIFQLVFLGSVTCGPCEAAWRFSSTWSGFALRFIFFVVLVALTCLLCATLFVFIGASAA